MPKLRGYKEGDIRRVRAGVMILRAARDLFVRVGAKKTADRIRAAITSAGGAERHSFRSRPAGLGTERLLPLPPAAALAAIAEIIYPGGKVSDEERDCIELFDQISGVVQDAGLGPMTDDARWAKTARGKRS